MTHATPMPDVAERTLPAAFARVLATAPDDPLLLADDGAYSYAQAHDRALRLAGGLRRLGVAAGDRVVLMLDNSAEAALVPRYVEILDELPKTPTQKVQKAVLRARGATAGTWDREAHGITVGRS